MESYFKSALLQEFLSTVSTGYASGTPNYNITGKIRRFYSFQLAVASQQVTCLWEYLSVSIIRQNKVFLKISGDIVSIAKSFRDLEGKKGETKRGLQILCEMDAPILAFLLSLRPTENFEGFPALVYPAPFALVCNCVRSARKSKPISPNQEAVCPSVTSIPA